jgi:predicted HTH transcriptional regulator
MVKPETRPGFLHQFSLQCPQWRSTNEITTRARGLSVTEQESAALLQLGHETHGVEFKGRGMPSDASFFAQVIRAVLGMANRRDGGLVILGVDSTTLDPEGFDEGDAQAWLDFDAISARVNVFAAPSVNFHPESVSFRGRLFVILRVQGSPAGSWHGLTGFLC